MRLGPAQIVRRHRSRIEPRVGVPVKNQGRLFQLIPIRIGIERRKPVRIQTGQIFANPHQFLQLGHGQIARHLGQLVRLIAKARRGDLQIRHRRFVQLFRG